jgi:starch synthase
MPENKITPAYDNKIYQKYSKKTIQNKDKNKIAFLQDIELPYHKKVPLICITYPLVDENNVQMILDIMAGILEQPVEVVLTAVGSPKFQHSFTQLADQNHQKMVISDGDETGKRKIYAASDMALIAGENKECMDEAKNALIYGCVPIMPPANFSENYDPAQEKGNAFIYNAGSPWSMFATFIRALENFRFPYDWKNIQMNGME